MVIKNNKNVSSINEMNKKNNIQEDYKIPYIILYILYTIFITTL